MARREEDVAEDPVPADLEAFVHRAHALDAPRHEALVPAVRTRNSSTWSRNSATVGR